MYHATCKLQILGAEGPAGGGSRSSTLQAEMKHFDHEALGVICGGKRGVGTAEDPPWLQPAGARHRRREVTEVVERLPACAPVCRSRAGHFWPWCRAERSAALLCAPRGAAQSGAMRSARRRTRVRVH